ncbi:OmpA/MotB family protein [Desulfoplanes sp. PS50]
MGRKQKKNQDDKGSPAWLVTFSDLMTLLLTFFVLLLSLASLMDERKTKLSLGSIMGSFGPVDGSFQPLTTKPGSFVKEPGAMEDLAEEDLEPLRDLIWEEQGEDFDFQSNRFIQVFSIDSEVMFPPGKATLLPRGIRIIERLLPVLTKVGFPLLITGHTGPLRSELAKGETYVVGQDDDGIDPSWDLSLQRVLSVYRLLVQGGVPAENLRMEGFGRFRPRAANTTPEGRAANRRVEFILDRRGADWSHQMARQTEKGGHLDEDTFHYRDFIFDLNGTKPQ